MSEQKFELSPDAIRRVVKATRRVETTRRKSIGQGQIEQAGAGYIPSQLAACISTTATSGVYPGILVAQQTPAGVDPPFSPVTSPNVPPPGRKPQGSSPVGLPSGMVPLGDGTQDCWLQFNSGITPTSGNVYACQVSGQTQSNLPILFTDDLSGGGGGGGGTYGLDSAVAITGQGTLNAPTIATGLTTPTNLGSWASVTNKPVGTNPNILSLSGGNLAIAVTGTFLVNACVHWFLTNSFPTNTIVGAISNTVVFTIVGISVSYGLALAPAFSTFSSVNGTYNTYQVLGPTILTVSANTALYVALAHDTGVTQQAEVEIHVTRLK